MTAAIVVDGLRKSYGATPAVKDVSFSIAEGEVFALLGPNGAGKTTCVEILEGYRHRDEGRVEVLGVDPEHGGRRLREQVGIVLQEAGVDIYLTVRELVTATGRLYPAPRSVDDILELVGLTEKTTSRVQRLSGGQRRRLDLALALVGDPALLFLDEPTTGFDPEARRHAWDIIGQLTELGKTVLLTTHYMDEAQQLADRVAVIAAGEIVAEGTPESLGGRDTASVRIRFELPPHVAVSDLPVAAVPVADAPGYLGIETSTPTEVLHRLTGWAVARGTELGGLTVERPTLEDMYLQLTRSDTAE